MNPTIHNLSLLLLAAAFAGCSSAPSIAPIDNSLLVEASASGKASIADARDTRDNAGDAHAAAQSNTKNARVQVELAEASLKTIRSQLDESKLAVEIAANTTTSQLESATSQHAYALARSDHARETLAVRKRELELAQLREKLALEEHRLSLALVELKKAEALQDVDLIAAQRIPIKDYRKQVTYHREEVATASLRVRSAEARLDEARGNLEDMQRKLDAQKPGS